MATPRWGAVTATATPTTPPFEAEARRQALLMVNIGTNVVWIGFSADVAEGNGIPIQGGAINNDGKGGSFTTNDYTGPVYLYAGSDTQVAYLEMLR